MKLSRDAIHALAGEYVLGTLRGGARRRFEQVARDDRDAGAILRRWQDALTPLADRVAPVDAPARVWRAIEARIAAGERPGGLWSSLAFRRRFGVMAAGAAATLLAAHHSLLPHRAPQRDAVLRVL